MLPPSPAAGGQRDFNALDFEINGIKPFNALMNRFAAKPPEGRTTRECPECLSSIPAVAGRCAFCSAEVPREGTIGTA